MMYVKGTNIYCVLSPTFLTKKMAISKIFNHPFLHHAHVRAGEINIFIY